MKKYLILLILMLSANISFAETYSCSASLARFGRPNESETKTYQRIGTTFLKVSRFGKNQFQILYESEDSLVLYEVKQYSKAAALFTALIHKQKLEFIENFSSLTDLESNNSSSQITGKCIVN